MMKRFKTTAIILSIALAASGMIGCGNTAAAPAEEKVEESAPAEENTDMDDLDEGEGDVIDEDAEATEEEDEDVMNVLGRRYPVGELKIFSSQVQGDKAHETIVEALRRADKGGCDVLILTRGGGSYEDLMAFNTEEVARAVALCETPIISAVGHETDTTLADYAADMRAPTPSAAAELCAPEAEQLIDTAEYMAERLNDCFGRYLDSLEARTEYLGKRLADNSPIGRIEREEERLRVLTDKMHAAIDRDIERKETALGGVTLRLGKAYERFTDEKRSRFEKLAAQLEALDPYRVLERGYTITMKDGAPVISAEALGVGDEITIRFRDRTVSARITGINGGEGKG